MTLEEQADLSREYDRMKGMRAVRYILLAIILATMCGYGLRAAHLVPVVVLDGYDLTGNESGVCPECDEAEEVAA